MRRSYIGQDNPFYGKHHSEETRELIRLRAHQRSKEPYQKSEEHRNKISVALKGRRASPEHVEKNRQSHIGINHTQEWRVQHSNQLKGKPISQQHKDAISKGNKGKYKTMPPFTEEHRRKIGEANRRRWHYPGFASKVLAKIRSCAKPTKPEREVAQILESHFPNEWQYVGDGKVIIDRMNPDFINCNSKKAVIEVFGDYWHPQDDELRKIQRYAHFGFHCLVIWQHELKQPDIVLGQIRGFIDAI